MAPSNKDHSMQQLYRTFISACHILHYHGVLDAYGHLSVRHPTKPDIFIMAQYIAPGTISSPDDLIEYYVENAEPVDPNATKGYSERCIHSSCYKRYPTVHSAIHSHSEAVIPYTITGVPLKPCYHMAGFLGSDVPVFDIADAYRPGDVPDMLVRDTHLGGALAAHFAGSDAPRHAVVLMRGHGMTVVAESIEQCVLRAVYTQKNAMIQTNVLTTTAAYNGGQSRLVRYLTSEEAKATAEMTAASAMRPWKLWLREIEAANLYVNSA